MPVQLSMARAARPARGRAHGWVATGALIAALAMTQLACTNLLALPLPGLVKTVISGAVYGDELKTQQLGRTVDEPLVATVRCNEATTTSRADGSYSLAVSQASEYTCTAVAPTYAAGQAIIVSGGGQTYHLDFGGPVRVATCGAPLPTPAATAAASPTRAKSTATVSATPTTNARASAVAATAVVCPALHLATGSISGVVTNSDDHAAASNTRISCWNPHTPDEDSTTPGTFETETDANGAFAFADLPVDRYLCTAGSDPTAKVMSPTPGGTTKVAISICSKHCPSVRYQGGTVMHTMTAYVLFWLPNGYSYGSAGSSHFESIVQRYFHDVGGSPYYNILTQYWDTNTGFILNQVTLGDVYVDKHPYPHAGTRGDPLLPGDIEQEAQAATVTRGWTSDLNHAIFVYTASSAEICEGSGGELCTYPNGSQEVFCGYHSLSDSNLVYALIADTPSCTGLNGGGSPNGDVAADQAIITTSHEQFESASDPDTRGWWGGNASTGEIGDKCVQSYRQVTLHGHPYWVQAEWSNAANGCAYSL